LKRFLSSSSGRSIYPYTKSNWNALVLRYFNKVKRGELSIVELVTLLETKGGVKYQQKHSLVRYPIEELIHYIAKLSNQNLNTENISSRTLSKDDTWGDHY
jgi:hypothetical protein